MIGRQYLRSRRAYTPRLWPFVLVAPTIVVVLVQLLHLRGWVVIPVSVVLGVGFAQLRWMIWRRRHPMISTEQWLDEQRQAAPWN